MHLFTQLRSWWRAVTHRSRLESEMDAELSFHMESFAEDLVRRGVPHDEAMRRARLELGRIEVQKEECRKSVGLRPWDDLWDDLRYGVRGLRKSPSFAAVAVISLTLGIGANTAIFTVAKKVLLDTLPVKNPHELRLLTWVSGHERLVPPVWGDVYATNDGGLTSTSFSYPVLEELRKKPDVFEDLFAFKDIDTMTATVDGNSEIISGELVSGNTFNALGVEPVLGRALEPRDDAGPGSGPVVVISESYWAQRFGRSNTVIGKTISINRVPVTIVGVSPAQFKGLKMGGTAQVFAPLTMQPLLVPRAQGDSVSLLDNPQSWWVLVMARLRPDVPEARTQAVLDLALRQTTMSMLSKTRGFDQFHLKLQPGERGLDYLQSYARPSYVLLALAGLVLLLACVNLANLLLARAATRQREMSTRLALGAGKARIVRQVLTESLLLSSLGGAAGLVLGYFGRNVIPRLFQNSSQPNAVQVDFDWRVLAFTVVASLVTGILFGIVPAWQATASDVNTALKDASHATASRHRMWLGKGLVIFQIALSSILLIGAGLFVRTLMNLSQTPLGFQADHLLLFRLNPPPSRYTDAQMTTFYQQLEEKLGAIPGVKAITASNIAIIGDGHSGSTFHVIGQPVQKEETRVQTNAVGADFFTTMGIPILQGRDFNTHDTASSPKVAVINRALARQFFPNENPIGQTFEADPEDVSGPVQIIGIAADTRYADLRSATPPTFYLSYQQHLEAGRIVIEIRTSAAPSSILSQARAVVASLDRDLPLIDARTMTEQINATMSGERIFAQLTSGFGLLAAILASIGIYGIMAYTVARRTNEIGIRMALGAQTEQVQGMVLREALWMAVAGVVLGVGGALWLARFISTMLYGLQPFDPLSIMGTTVLLLCITVLAGFIPARRASRVDPILALRHD